MRYDPRLPDPQQILNKHYRSLTTDPYMKEVFPLPPMVAYKRPKTIGEMLIRAKIAPEHSRQRRSNKGMFKCNKPCVTCPYIKVGKIAKSTARDHKVELQQHFNCHTRNIIYLIECKKCLQQYLGESKRSLAERIGNHRGYVNNKNFWKWATGEHFNSKGHSLSDMTVMVIEKLRQTDETYRKEREKMHIRDFQAKHSGMNRKT